MHRVPLVLPQLPELFSYKSLCYADDDEYLTQCVLCGSSLLYAFILKRRSLSTAKQMLDLTEDMKKSTLLCQMLNITKVRIFMLMLIPFPNIFLRFLLSAHYVHFLSLFSFPSDLRLIAQYSPSSTHSPAYPYFAFMPSIFYHLSDRLLMHNPSKKFGF